MLQDPGDRAAGGEAGAEVPLGKGGDLINVGGTPYGLLAISLLIKTTSRGRASEKVRQTSRFVPVDKSN